MSARGIHSVVLMLSLGYHSVSSSGCTVKPTDKDTAPAAGEYVILIHGLARTRNSMRRLEKSLIAHGYHVSNITYPSRKYPVEQVAEENLGTVIERCREAQAARIHFVTHSIGGLLVRYYLKHHHLPELGRVVMLSPPNQGTELVDRLRNNRLFQVLNGPAGLQMGTDPQGVPARLGPVKFDLGVIAGSRSLNPINSRIIPGPDDGVIAVERTRVVGMSDFLVVPHNHTFIMMRRDVIRQVVHFLACGTFRAPETTVMEGAP